MELNAISLFDLTSRRMEWLSQRQAVVTENIANANTPRFKARDVASFESLVAGRAFSGLDARHDRHLEGTSRAQIPVMRDDTAWDESIDGNTVVLEQQTVRANEVFEQYRLATQIYKKGHDLIGLALVGNR